jgi:hypothetical protein
MNRRKAVAVSVASAATLASFAVAMAAALNVGVLGFGHHDQSRAVPAATVVTTAPPAPETTTTVAPEVVVQQRDVFDRHVIIVPDPVPAEIAPASTAGDASTPNESAAPREPETTTPTTMTSNTQPREAEDDEHEDSSGDTSTQASAPPGCVRGVLEDDGVWNCQH